VLVIVPSLLLVTACQKDSPHGPDEQQRQGKPPISRAGSDSTVYQPFSTCALDGFASTDPDSNIVSYQWRQVAGYPNATLSSPDRQRTSVSGLTQVAKYVFELTVTDDDRLASKDTVTITVAGPHCTGSVQTLVFESQAWNYAWIMEIAVFDFFSYLPPNSYIKNIYIKRDGSANWEKVVPLDVNSPNYGKVHEWEFGNGVLVIYPGKNLTDDTPDIKVEYCQ